MLRLALFVPLVAGATFKLPLREIHRTHDQVKLPFQAHQGHPNLGDEEADVKTEKALETSLKQSPWQQAVLGLSEDESVPSSQPTKPSFGGILSVINITIGTPPKEFTALLDTGPGPLFVPSAQCPGYPDSACWRDFQDHFNSSESSTYQDYKVPVRSAYETWMIEGSLAGDVVSLGDAAVYQRAFLEATQMRPLGFLYLAGFESALSLARFTVQDSETTPADQSFFSSLTERGILDRNVFSLKFFQEANLSGTSGELTLGEVDDEYVDELVELPIDESYPPTRGYWTTSVGHMAFGDREVDFSNRTGVFKTADSFIELSPDIFGYAMEQTGASGGGIFPYVDCDKRSQFPDLVLQLGPDRHAFMITGEQYTFELREDFDVTGNGRLVGCYVPFIPGDEQSRTLEIGTGFLKAFYSLFDDDRASVSLAPIRVE